MKITAIFLILLFSALLVFFYFSQQDTLKIASEDSIISGTFDKKALKKDHEWKNILTEKQYHILREKGTEVPFTGKLLNEKRKGIFYSHGCDKPVFSSETKYDSGTGWPSFTSVYSDKNIVLRRDTTSGDNRIEVLDSCGGHLGHVFDDGPLPSGKRYCINSEALYFVPVE